MKQLSILFTAIAIFLLSSALWNSSAADEDPIAAAGAFRFNEGTVAPEFSIRNLVGDQVTLKDFRGKVVLLDFWATW